MKRVKRRNGRKGVTLAIWIWIMGGVAIASLVFYIGYYYIYQIQCQNSRQNVQEQFNSIVRDVELVCSQGIGARKSREVSLGVEGCGAKAIYASDLLEYNAKVPFYIANSEKTEGKYLCLSFEKDQFNCLETPCTVNFTVIGTPLEDSDMYKLGIGDKTFKFKLSISKPEFGKVNVDALHIP